MIVKDLIAQLQTLDPNLLVVYPIFSEQCLLEPEDVQITDLCFPRPDGWVQNKRPDMPTQQYVRIG